MEEWHEKRFIDQFLRLEENSPLTYKPFSVHRPAIRDMSFWISDKFVLNDFHEIVRDEGDEWIENVELVDEYQSPEGNEDGVCVLE